MGHTMASEIHQLSCATHEREVVVFGACHPLFVSERDLYDLPSRQTWYLEQLNHITHSSGAVTYRLHDFVSLAEIPQTHAAVLLTSA